MVLPVLPAAAEPVTSADEDTDSQRQDDIVVVGKSYGQAVGKTVTPLKDVPNTITVIDQELLQQRNLFTLEDALTVTNGVTITGIGSEDPSYLSRGFTINNYLVDGVPTFSFAFPAVVPDLFLYDRVEVLRGPAGLFSGAGNPAGSINLVRKRPLAERSVSALAGYGSYQNLRAELDVSTPLDDHSGMRTGRDGAGSGPVLRRRASLSLCRVRRGRHQDRREYDADRRRQLRPVQAGGAVGPAGLYRRHRR
ncbi:TonB-dependent siderophore receptor [Sphingomonas hankookensis]|uniref:TonB-dependent siderophore receptor n=1 Tax=Sphingomonas hankookensis TaxID=563996 RepID=UPI003D303C6F